jgi:hypothetical protein
MPPVAWRLVTSRMDESRLGAPIMPQLSLNPRLRLGQTSLVNSKQSRCKAIRICVGIVNAQNFTSVSSIFGPNNVHTQFHHFLVTFPVWELYSHSAAVKGGHLPRG